MILWHILDGDPGILPSDNSLDFPPDIPPNFSQDILSGHTRSQFASRFAELHRPSAACWWYVCVYVCMYLCVCVVCRWLSEACHHITSKASSRSQGWNTKPDLSGSHFATCTDHCSLEERSHSLNHFLSFINAYFLLPSSFFNVIIIY